MDCIKFTWDLEKAQQNKRKHGVLFEDAKTAFWDENAIIISDPDHSESEERFLLIGMNSHSKLLVIVHCYRDSDETIRIISARKASRNEEKTYARRWL